MLKIIERQIKLNLILLILKIECINRKFLDRDSKKMITIFKYKNRLLFLCCIIKPDLNGRQLSFKYKCTHTFRETKLKMNNFNHEFSKIRLKKNSFLILRMEWFFNSFLIIILFFLNYFSLPINFSTFSESKLITIK